MEKQNIDDLCKLLSAEFGLQVKPIRSLLELIDEGATIPFIARYRKERTGGMDEVQIGDIKKRYTDIIELNKRKETVISTIDAAGKLTPELKKQIMECIDAVILEDIYLPYKPKRKTKASIAKERGLEPLATLLWKQGKINIEDESTKYINDNVKSVDDALAGARDIIAEWISEDAITRNRLRSLFSGKALISSHVAKAKEEEGQKYKDYFSFSEPLNRCPSHRLLAVLRGEDEGFLRMGIAPSEEEAIVLLERLNLRSQGALGDQIKQTIEDSYNRLLQPSLETEFKNLAKIKADEEAIRVFADNLRQLLLAAPLGTKRVLAIDPGFRTGCKIVCLDEKGDLLHNTSIFPHAPQNETQKAGEAIMHLAEKYKIEAIAIGNGTAGRESEEFIRSLSFKQKTEIYMVNESGASIYSASEAARKEFPNHDITVRGSISIGRRLADPLAELVKIDAKSIGVGQYQHDVDQKKLAESLDTVVESCVNHVGVEVNTASYHLLQYVSGIGPQLAKNITEYRAKKGSIKSRQELKKITRMGDKAFEQAAGFLRVAISENPLDNSAVHPESYAIVTKMAKDLNSSVSDIINDEKIRSRIVAGLYVTEKAGLPTIRDILNELAKPGRDPREEVKTFSFSADVHRVEDLHIGMVLPGIVTNITNFGAFVDIGVKQDGLVHISHLADKYVKAPSDVVKLQQQVKVKVMNVDVARKRIELSMKNVNV